MLAATFLLGLLQAPAAAATYVERRDALVADYLAATRSRLRQAREKLEGLQELLLTPHATDEPAEAALLHLDLAEAALEAAAPTLAALPASAPPPGWAPFEERKEAALKFLRASAPDLAAVYDKVPAAPGPLERNEVGRFEGAGSPRIFVRGYYAVSNVSPEYLATILAHEATHALQCESAHARGEIFEGGPKEEAEARRREAALWKALGSPKDKDLDGAATAVAAAVDAGEAALARHEETEGASPKNWEWVTPAAQPPARPSTAAAAASASADGTPEAVPPDVILGGIRADFAEGAQNRLEDARAVLGTTVELAAPFPKIVNFELVQVWGLSPKRYPPSIHMAFQALHPAVTELDKARTALSASSISEEDRTLLERYASVRAVVRDWPARSVKGALLASTPVGDAPPSKGARVTVPGAWVDRSTNTDVAGAWAAHVRKHVAQNAGPVPTLEQELEAVEASLSAWEAAGSDERFDKAHPDRFLRYRVFQQSGGREGLRAYLKKSGFE